MPISMKFSNWLLDMLINCWLIVKNWPTQLWGVFGLSKADKSHLPLYNMDVPESQRTIDTSYQPHMWFTVNKQIFDRYGVMSSMHYILILTQPPSLTVMAPLSSSVLLPFIPPMFTEQPETAIDCLTSSLHSGHPIPYRNQLLSDLQWPLCHSPHHRLATSDLTAPRCHCLN